MFSLIKCIINKYISSNAYFGTGISKIGQQVGFEEIEFKKISFIKTLPSNNNLTECHATYVRCFIDTFDILYIDS